VLEVPHYARRWRREHVFLKNVCQFQQCGQVNNPSRSDGAHIRTLEWKHMMPPETAGSIQGTVITREFPCAAENSDHYEYPFPDERNHFLYKAYRTRAASRQRLLICGRLGEYRYFDMDQAIGRALRIAQKILSSIPRERSYPTPGPRDSAGPRPIL
jgi:UDP-galactopyranose mutase